MTGYRCLNRTSIGPRPRRESSRPGREGHWEREKVLVHPRPVLDRTRSTGRPVPQPIELVGHSLDRLSLFGPENLFFLIPLFSNTYARSLFELLSQL